MASTRSPSMDRDRRRPDCGPRGPGRMTCTNAAATLPFGAIDTPTQGGVAAGNSYVNFGWALTQNPKSIPVDGSTMTVLVDGVALGKRRLQPLPAGHRHDVSPGLANSNGAVGLPRILDTTAMTEGLDNSVLDRPRHREQYRRHRQPVLHRGPTARRPTAAVRRSRRNCSRCPGATRATRLRPCATRPRPDTRPARLEPRWAMAPVRERLGQPGRVMRGEEVDCFELQARRPHPRSDVWRLFAGRGTGSTPYPWGRSLAPRPAGSPGRLGSASSAGMTSCSSAGMAPRPWRDRTSASCSPRKAAATPARRS